MSWIHAEVLSNGVIKYWIRDERDGYDIFIEAPDGADIAYAEHMKKKYDARLALEKHGYDDRFANPVADELFGKRIKETGNGMG